MLSDPSGLYPGSFPWMIAELSRCLQEAGVVHGFGGALALAYAVEEPRGTIDIDLNIVADPAHPEPVLAAFPAGVSHSAADVAQIQRDGQVRLWWVHEGRRVPLDLFFPQHSLHALVASRTREVAFGSTSIPVISATDILIFKALFNRPKDWVDIAAIVEAGTADVDEALRWIAQLVGEDNTNHQRLLALST